MLEIVFENGSRITTIDNSGECIKGIVRDFTPVVKLEVGLKIECRDYIYQGLLQEKYIQDNFKLNAKRLNRWWYSVYFDRKD